MDNPNIKLPPRGELLAKSLFGTPAQRENASRLWANMPPGKDDDEVHTFFRAQFPYGSQTERNYLESPEGRRIEGIVAAQPQELGTEDNLAGNEITGDVVCQRRYSKEPEPPLPVPAVPVEEPHTLAATMRLKEEQRHRPMELKKPSWQVAPPTPSIDLGELKPLNW